MKKHPSNILIQLDKFASKPAFSRTFPLWRPMPGRIFSVAVPLGPKCLLVIP
ncbi:hypothetical protein DM56_4564 [Burkholderia mallei]|nr:hypothetical protein DM56_4564 [Burkholderia mallei]